MIRYFRINDPYRLVGLLILLLLMHLPLFIDMPGVMLPELNAMVLGEKLNEGNAMYATLVDNTAPLAAWCHELADSLFGRSLLARRLIGFLIIFLQGAYLGIMLINRKAFNENTYIPSFLFCVLFFFSVDSVMLSGELLGSTFLLFAMSNLFKEIEFRAQRDETVFNLGFFISLASLFSFGLGIYIFCVMFIIVFFTRTTPRKFLLMLFGFLLPHLLVLTIAYVNGSLAKTWHYAYVANLSLSRDVLMGTKSLLALAAVPVSYFAISLIMLQREARFSKYQSQLLQIMFLWIAFSLLYVLICKDLRPQNLIVFIPGLSFVLTHFFLFIRRRKFIELNVWILFTGIIAVAYLGRYEKTGAISYRNLLANDAGSPYGGKKLLVLENNIGFYLNNMLATPYLNWNLSETVFRNPNYYENITEVYQALTSDPPDVIIDRENLMRPFFDRIPSLEQRYRRQSGSYVLVSNN